MLERKSESLRERQGQPPVPIPRPRAKPRAPVLLDARAEAERARDHDVGLVKLGKHLCALARELYAAPEAVVNVARKRRDVVGRVLVGVGDELVLGAVGQRVLGHEARVVFDERGRGREIVHEVLHPGEGRVAEGREEEDLGARKGLVERVAGWGGGG